MPPRPWPGPTARYIQRMTRTRVLYNDTCPICAREIAHYDRLARQNGLPLDFAPLSSDAGAWGLAPDSAARRLHAQQGDRRLDGIDAFVAIWAQIPRYRWLAWLCRQPVIGGAVRVLYDRVAAPALFALHRRRQRARG